MSSLEERVARPVVSRTPGMERVRVRGGISYKTVGDIRLCLDAYYPTDERPERRQPAVILTGGSLLSSGQAPLVGMVSDDTTDPEYLRYQYGDSEKLRIRGESHARYSENPQPLSDWVLAHLAPTAGQLLVDVGCGHGGYHRALSRRGVRVVGFDVSFGMVSEARQRVRRESLQVFVVQARAEALPLPDACAERAMANHVLYHVPDRMRALREMRRVLRAGGRAILATNARDTMQRLTALHATAARDLGYTPVDTAPERHFSLDDLPLVRSVFPTVECHVYEDAFLFPSAEAAVRYYASGMIDRIRERSAEGAHRTGLARLVARRIEVIIEQEGVLRVPKRAGCFVAEV